MNIELMAVVLGASLALHSNGVPVPDTSCDVTLPNGVVAGSAQSQAQTYGNRLLSVHGVQRSGTIEFKPGGGGWVTRDGALAMKIGWTRAIPGLLVVSGHRLDGDAPPLRVEMVPSRKVGFQGTALIFPTLGCWDISAQVSDVQESKLTFVTYVVKIGVGPTRLR